MYNFPRAKVFFEKMQEAFKCILGHPFISGGNPSMQEEPDFLPDWIC